MQLQALGAFCCRFVVYTTVHLMPTYWIVPPFEMLHGITFGIAWAAGVNYWSLLSVQSAEAVLHAPVAHFEHSSQQNALYNTYLGISTLCTSGRGIRVKVLLVHR